MSKPTIKSQHTASYSQLNELLSVAANVDKAIIQKLGTKANAASLGAATTRITSLETNSATKAQLSDAIRGLTILDKTTRQLVIDYMLPPYRSNVAYREGQIVRLGGYVFQSKVDNNNASPYTFITNGDGQIIVNDNWEALILADVNEDNWAQLEAIPTMSIPERMDNVESRMTTAEQSVTQMQGEFDTNFAQRISELEAQYATQFNAYADALNQANALIAQQAKVIQNLQNRIAFMDGLTIMVSDNRNDSDSYTDNQ